MMESPKDREFVGVMVLTTNRMLPFPTDTLKIVLSPATYANLVARYGGGVTSSESISPFLVVSTSVDEDTSTVPDVVASIPTENEGEILFYRYAIVGVVDDSRRERHGSAD